MPVLSAKRLAAVLAVLGAAFLQATPAEAAEQFPSGTNLEASVEWSGNWESVRRMDDITVQLCDLDLVDSNDAIARLEVWLENSQGAIRRELAPVVMRIRQSGAESCDEYANMYLGYSEYLRYVRVVYGGSVSGLTSGTRWVRNPHSDF
jgi:hypothetical protein